MIKNLLITYLFLITNVFAGLPPTTMRGQSQTLKPTTFNFQVPNKQATITAASTSLIETGNNNELENRGFEHTTVTTGWMISNATPSSSTTRIEGSKSLSLALTGALSLSQSSTINAAQKSGVQMVASIWVNSTDVSDLRLCSLKNGSEDKCTVTGGYVQGSGWRQLTVSFLGNSTSNGIKLKSTDTTGTVLVDQAYVGIGSPIVDFTPDMVYSAKVSGAGAITNENTDWLSSCTIGGSGSASCTYTTGLVSQAMNCEASFDNANSLNQSISVSSSSSTGFTVQTSAGGAFANLGFYIICQKQGADYKTSKAYVASSSDFGYTNAGAITITATTTNPTKGTVVTDRIMASRKGQNLIAEYQYEQSSVGGSGSGDYLFSLPSGLSFDTNIVIPFSGANLLSSASSATKATVGYGSVTDNGNNQTICKLIAYDATRFRVVCNYFSTTGGAVLGYVVGSVGFGMGSFANFSFGLRLQAPIQGWTDSSVIVGSFEGIEKCANDYECTDTFSAQISSAGVVSNQNIPWISSVSKGGTGIYNITYNTNLKNGVNSLSSIMNCVAVIASANSEVADVVSSVSTGVTVNILGSAADRPFTIKCQKGTNDYKPKTAKVASSIGVPTVPGVTTQAIDTFSVSYGTTNATTACSASPCSYLDQIGSAVTSVTRSGTGSYSINTTKTYTKLKCNINSSSPSGTGVSSGVRCENCSSITFYTTNVNVAGVPFFDTYGTLQCQGSY